MNILITGGFGHLGSELIKVLSAKKKIRKIFIIDNFLTQRFCSFINLENKKKIILYDENVTKFKFSNIKSKVDKVVHLAAITNAEESIKNQKEVIKNNLHSTKMVVNFCKKEKIPLIFASSTSVYGDQFKTINSKNNQHKDMLKPQSPYAKCKIYEEEYIKSNIKNYTILRLGTICGISEGMRFHTAINKFCYQAVLSKPITIWRKLYTKQRPYLVLNDFTKLKSQYTPPSNFKVVLVSGDTIKAEHKKAGYPEVDIIAYYKEDGSKTAYVVVDNKGDISWKETQEFYKSVDQKK
jgi:nucleoside-diphosphate-sugar epimerase